MMIRACFTLLYLLATTAQADQILRSQAQQATVLELYTSEGCSSCPPADSWFTSLKEHPQLWQALIPIAFHVDYWNYLGWEDRFATAAFGERQRNYQRQGSSRGVYTPGVFLTGREWRNWRKAPGAIPLVADEVGVLELHEDGERFTAQFSPNDRIVPLASRLHIAVLGFGLDTPVKSGENRGRNLRHDFVVLAHEVFVDEDMRWSGKIPEPILSNQAERLALVVWVSAGERLGPIQAVGNWFGE